MTGTARITGMTVKMTRMTKMTWITGGGGLESQQPIEAKFQGFVKSI